MDEMDVTDDDKRPCRQSRFPQVTGRASPNTGAAIPPAERPAGAAVSTISKSICTLTCVHVSSCA